MPKQRARVDDLRAPQNIQPAASPVNTYYTPAEQAVAKPAAGKNSLEQLAESLKTFSPNISVALWRMRDRRIASEIEKGELLAAKTATMMKFNDAVAAGKIPKDANPSVAVGWNRGQLRNLGNFYSSNIQTNFYTAQITGEDGEAHSIFDATDPFIKKLGPAAVNLWLSKQRANLFNNPLLEGMASNELEEVLLPRVEQVEAQFTNKYITERNQQIYDGLFEEVGNNIGAEAVSLATQFGNVPTGDTQAQIQMVNLFGTRITEQIEEARLHGAAADMERLKKTSVDSVVNSAKLLRNPKILSVLDTIEWGPGGKLGGTSYAREQIANAKASITSAQATEEDRNYKLQQRSFDDSIDKVTTQAETKLFENPAADVSDEIAQLTLLVSQGADGAAEKLHSLRSLQKTFTDPGNIENDPEIMMNLTTRALRGDDVNQLLMTAVKNKKLKPETARAILGQADGEQDQERKEWVTLFSSMVTDEINSVNEQLAPLPAFKKLSPVQKRQVRKDFRRQAVSYLNKTMKSYKDGLPLPSDEEQYSFLDKTAERIIKKYDRPSRVSTPRQTSSQQPTKEAPKQPSTSDQLTELLSKLK
jgi:hypothetical protein